jgi:hypothetical protein
MSAFEKLLVSLLEQFRVEQPELVRQAVQLSKDQSISDMVVDRNTISGVVSDDDGDFEVEVIVDPRRGTYSFYCTCEETSDLCVHAMALLLSYTLNATQAPQAMVVPASSMLSGVEPRPFPRLFPQPIWPFLQASAVEQAYRTGLQGYTVKQLREMAARRGIRIAGIRREVILETVIAGLLAPGSADHALQDLSPQALRALDLLVTLGAELVAQNPEEYLYNYLDEALRPWRPGPDASAALKELLESGLLFRTYNTLQLAPDLSARRAPDPALFQPYSGPVERVQAAEPEAFTHLALRIALVGQTGALKLEPPSKVDPQGWPVRISNQPAATDLSVAEEDSLLNQDTLFQLGGERTDDRLRVDLAARLLDAGRFWKPGHPDRLEEAFSGWLQHGSGPQARTLLDLAARLVSTWELDVARTTAKFSMGRNSWGVAYPDFARGLAQARMRLLRLLAFAPAGQWFETTPLLKVLHGLQPYWMLEIGLRNRSADQLKTVLNSLPTWVKQGGKKMNLLDFDAWEQTFGWYYRTVLADTFCWLGLVDIAWQKGEPVAFRLTEFGEYLLERRSDFPQSSRPPAAPALSLDADNLFQLNPETADPETVSLVLLIGIPQANKNARPAAAGLRVEAKSARPSFEMSYAIGMEGLGRAFKGGWDEARIRSVLEHGLGHPLPEKLSASLSAIWEHFGRLHIYDHIAILQFADDYCLPELLANTSLNQVMLYAFSPRVIAVRPDRMPEFIAELRTKGYTPLLQERVEDRPGEAPSEQTEKPPVGQPAQKSQEARSG